MRRTKEIETYQDLEVWKKSIDLVVEIYRITKSFPKEEIYSLTSQIRRAAISIPANIAEGWGRSRTKEYIQFLRISRGSLLELETHLILSERLKYLEEIKSKYLLVKTKEIGRMLNGLIRSLNKKL